MPPPTPKSPDKNPATRPTAAARATREPAGPAVRGSVSVDTGGSSSSRNVSGARDHRRCHAPVRPGHLPPRAPCGSRRRRQRRRHRLRTAAVGLVAARVRRARRPRPADRRPAAVGPLPAGGAGRAGPVRALAGLDDRHDRPGLRHRHCRLRRAARAGDDDRAGDRTRAVDGAARGHRPDRAAALVVAVRRRAPFEPGRRAGGRPAGPRPAARWRAAAGRGDRHRRRGSGGARWAAAGWPRRVAAAAVVLGRGRSAASSGPAAAAPVGELRVALVQGGGPAGDPGVEHRRTGGVRASPRRPARTSRRRSIWSSGPRTWSTSTTAGDVRRGPGAAPTSPGGSTRRSSPAWSRTPVPTTSPTPRSPTTPTARSSTATTRSTAFRSASTCRCAALLERFGGGNLTSRDAVIGEHPRGCSTPRPGGLGVAISWEIFFGDRVREGVEDGAEVVLNPTNGSSFTGTLVQTQQVAASRMRAIESDRWLLQVAPTGFSRDHRARRHGPAAQCGVASRRCSTAPSGCARARPCTPVSGFGPAMVGGGRQLGARLVARRWRQRRRQPRGRGLCRCRRGDGQPAPPAATPAGGRLQPDAPRPRVGLTTDMSGVNDEGDRPVVDEGDAHVGPEAPGRHLGPEPS